MFAIMYELEGEKVFKIFKEYDEARNAANNIAGMGHPVTVFDYDIIEQVFLEFYTIA